MAVLSQFECLAETLVPQLNLPPGFANPLLIQGYFVQVSLSPNAGVSSVNFNLVFTETTDFGLKQGGGTPPLMAQIIDANGGVQIYQNFFSSTSRGFLSQSINFGETLIYGIQVLMPKSGGLPGQNGIGWRGSVQVNASAQGALVCNPTHRLVYYPDLSAFPKTVQSATVYPVQTASGNGTI